MVVVLVVVVVAVLESHMPGLIGTANKATLLPISSSAQRRSSTGGMGRPAFRAVGSHNYGDLETTKVTAPDDHPKLDLPNTEISYQPTSTHPSRHKGSIHQRDVHLFPPAPFAVDVLAAAVAIPRDHGEQCGWTNRV